MPSAPAMRMIVPARASGTAYAAVGTGMRVRAMIGTVSARGFAPEFGASFAFAVFTVVEEAEDGVFNWGPGSAAV